MIVIMNTSNHITYIYFLVVGIIKFWSLSKFDGYNIICHLGSGWSVSHPGISVCAKKKVLIGFPITSTWRRKCKGDICLCDTIFFFM